MEWEVEFYADEKGKEPVAEFFDSLPVKLRAKVTRYIQLLQEKGVLLKEPYTKQIRGKIREIRINDNAGNARILYFTFTGKKFILLHGFIKTTEKTPENAIEIAEKRMNDFNKRFGGKK